jgi:hypothetical protein
MTQVRQLTLLGMAAVVALLIWTRCSNEFDLIAEWKEIPVVYGIISPDDTAHYIRVEKAFLDPNTSALVTAQIADSLYYPENAISVFLVRVTSGEEYQLRRVDGNLEGLVRDSGTFAQAPNYLYKIRDNEILGGIRKREQYRLVVRRADNQEDITAVTLVPDETSLRLPDLNDAIPLINFFPRSTTTIRWSHDQNSAKFSVNISVRYREENAQGAIMSRDTLLWKVGELNAQNLQSTSIEAAGSAFYTFLAENIPPAAAGRTRFFDRFEIIVTGGGREIRDFIAVQEANAGLSGAEIIRTYSNMSEGYGIFSARNVTRFPGIRVDKRTVDSMDINPLTVGLNFGFF